MDTKIIGRITLIFLILFFFLNCKQEYSSSFPNNKIEKDQDSTVTSLLVKFVDTGSFSLNTLLHQRGKSFTLFGKNKDDQKTLKVFLSKPTVFTSYRLENNKTVSRQYISFGNDTLRFEFNKEKSLFKGNRKNNILNILFTENEDFHFLDNPVNLDKYIDSLYIQHQIRLKKLSFYSTDFNKTQLSVIQNYLLLYYYFKVFNINFSKLNSSDANLKLRTKYYELLDNIALLNSTNTILTKQIIYNILRYTAFINKTQLYQSIGLIDERLRKTEAFSGFLDDLLNYSSNTLSVNDINEIKKYLPIQPVHIEKKNNLILTDSVLSQSVKNFQSKEIKFQNILSTKTEDFVLVDLWATWCIPCIQENPYWENSKKKFNGKIKFVKISIDINEYKWQKYIMKNGSEEDNFIITNPNNLFIKNFKINSIPRLILFNKNFEVKSDDFLRPSDDNFENLLQKYLTQK